MKNWTDTEKALYRNTEASNTLWASIDFGIDSSGAAVTYDIAATNIVANTTKLIQSISDAEQLKYGSVEPSMFEIQIAQDTAQVERLEASAIAGMGRGKIWDCAQGRKLTVYIKKGIIEHSAEFFIKSIKGEGTTGFKTITAYDMLSFFDVDVSEWYNALYFPLTLRDFRTRLCNFCRIPDIEDKDLCNDDIHISKTITATSITGREVLSSCCELNACWPQMDIFGTGKLKWIQLGADSSETFAYDDYDQVFRPESTREEYEVKGINSVVIRATSDDVGGHYPETVQDNPYIIEGNFLAFGKTTAELSTIAQSLFEEVSNRPYRPHNTLVTGRPYLDCGDKITIKFAGGAGGSFDTYILKRTLTGEAALADVYAAKGQKEHKNSYGISHQIQQIQGRTNELSRTVDETKNTITRIEYLTPVQSAADPSNEWSEDEKPLKEGYQWFDGTDIRIWDGEKWQLTIIPDYNQSTTPTNATEGQYWYNPTSGEMKKLIGDTWTVDNTVCISTTWTQSMQTTLKITAEGVQSTVTKDNIISTINQSAEAVSINASKIDLSGYVTINSLKSGGTTEIDGGRIKTGTVAAARIDVDNLYVKHLSAADGTFAGTLSAVTGTFANLDAAGYRVHLGTDYISINGVEIGYIPSVATQICVIPNGSGVGNIGIGNYYWDQVKANRFAQASSERYKKNILNAADSDFSDIAEIRIVTYENKNGKSGRQIGVIAEELYKVFPYAVTLDDNGIPDGVEYGKLSLLAIEKIQKLERRVAVLEKGGKQTL